MCELADLTLTLDGPATIIKSQAVTRVVRLHLRSTMSHVDHRRQEEFCLGQPGWAGVGWGCWEGHTPSSMSWADYQSRKGEPVNESVRRIYDLPIGTLVWTRRRDGTYWLGELEGPWGRSSAEPTNQPSMDREQSV